MTGELLDRFINTHYTDLMIVLPAVLMLAGLLFTVAADSYITRRRKRTMALICVLVLSLIAQNYLENLLSSGEPRVMLRTCVSIYGYAVRPVILLLFIYIVSPGKQVRWGWILIGLNAAVYLSALFTDVTFSISSDNHYRPGFPLLSNFCLFVSFLLLVLLLYLTLRNFRAYRWKETFFPAASCLLIILSVVMDSYVGGLRQPVSFLTIAIVISCVLFYYWLHFQFLQEHEQARALEQRIQLMMTQIQPHFLYNTLATIRSLCLRSPETAAHTIDQFSLYLRQNLEAMDQPDLIPLKQELEHVRIYAEIEMLMFPYIHVTYDTRDEDVLLPALTVQPLVENAIRHGVRAREEGLVHISSLRDRDGHYVIISDNGVGFDPEAVPEKPGAHIGLRNVRERIEKQCGGRLDIDSTPGKGTTVTIFIPDPLKDDSSAS